ncbi:MAG: diguanylate cyclase, partial [Lawsonibacter sp.]|nr:diguanylate cyclase [Lawsonibacter sp.]
MSGKSASEAFHIFGTKAAEHLIRLGNEVYASTEKVGEAHISVFHHAYKTTFFFISDTLLLAIYEDVHAQLLRQYFHRTIPYDVILKSISERKGIGDSRLISDEAKKNAVPLHKAIFASADLDQMTIIPEIMNMDKMDDAVFLDSLTGLYDRYFAMEALKMYVEQGVLPLSIVLGDINGLYRINEAVGYEGGDEIVVTVANEIRKHCRESDVVARWSSDSFLLLMPYTSRKQTEQMIAQMEKNVNSFCEGGGAMVTFGYATSDRQSRQAEELIREAEKWTYRKKLLVRQSHRSGFLQLLLSMLHEKSAETQDHSDRMAKHCQRIAEQMELSSEMINDLLLLAMLHDIGKLGIPDAILNKPGSLTPEERCVIQRHPEIGYRITRKVSELFQVSGYILAHHEYWDGTGYPKGLRGEEIPVASRIIAVVDAFDVMISGRSYRGARSKEEAITELRRCAGTQFDPYLVDTYIHLLKREANDNLSGR